MTSCTECGTSPAPFSTVSGRELCADCHRRLAQVTGAAVALGSGGTAGEAIVTAVATGAFHGAAQGEAAAMASRRAKLEATQGFWRRMWVRVVG